MNGSHALLTSLVDAGVDVCFMNPGTSEMHFVKALDSEPRMRGVLALSEGVATGAADGYARITGKPAATLLHLGPGLGNGLANLHNARRARTPMLVIVGAHATSHVRYDAPLQSDIESVARTFSGTVHTSGTTRALPSDAMRLLAATQHHGGEIATLILPADVSWTDGAKPSPVRSADSSGRTSSAVVEQPRSPGAEAAVSTSAARMKEGATVLLIGNKALTERGLTAADRIAQAPGVRVIAETFPARIEGGAGTPTVGRLAYLAERAEEQLADAHTLILAGATSPVSFFAYPGKSSDLVPAGCDTVTLAEPGDDIEGLLEALADRVAPDAKPRLSELSPPDPGSGPLTVANLSTAIAHTLPDNAIISDEAVTSGFGLPTALATAARHSLLTLTGGAIGQGMPVATGAAIAAPDRPVLNIQADGSALYTIQSLWTQARENLNVTTVLINNAAYAILRVEFARTGAGEATGTAASRMLDLCDPTPDFVSIAQGFGVPASRVTTVEELTEQLKAAYAEPGPHLIEAVVPSVG